MCDGSKARMETSGAGSSRCGSPGTTSARSGADGSAESIAQGGCVRRPVRTVDVRSQPRVRTPSASTSTVRPPGPRFFRGDAPAAARGAVDVRQHRHGQIDTRKDRPAAPGAPDDSAQNADPEPAIRLCRASHRMPCGPVAGQLRYIGSEHARFGRSGNHWIWWRLRPPEPCAQVRILPGAPLREVGQRGRKVIQAMPFLGLTTQCPLFYEV
jgi:hypothetical protein